MTPDQYEPIASDYTGVTEAVVTRPYVELFSFFKLVGDVEGRSILDVPCGDGELARHFKAAGAARVLGVDISLAMVDLASERERREPIGIEYMVCDAAELPTVGRFDVVIAAHLLHYAETEARLGEMCRRLRANLVPGGRLAAIVVNPGFDPNGPNCTRYGFTMRYPDPCVDGSLVHAEIHSSPPHSIAFYHWSRATYERVLAESGFADVEWHAYECSPDGERRFGREFWSDYLRNPDATLVGATAAD